MEIEPVSHGDMEAFLRIPTADGSVMIPRWEIDFNPSGPLGKMVHALQRLYYACIARIVYACRYYRWKQTANAVGSLMAELRSVLYVGYWLLWGRAKTFHYYGLNPETLTEEQKEKPAILLLHGKGSNHAVWIELAKTFQREGIPNVFTLNSRDGELTDDDIPLFEEKLQQIQARYGEKKARIILIGHSRGAEFSLYAALPPDTFSMKDGYCTQKKEWMSFRPEIHLIIRLGSPLLAEERKRLPEGLQSSIYEIDGLRDLLIPDRSSHPFYRADCGHVELLYHKGVHRAIVQLVRA